MIYKYVSKIAKQRMLPVVSAGTLLLLASSTAYALAVVPQSNNDDVSAQAETTVDSGSSNLPAIPPVVQKPSEPSKPTPPTKPTAKSFSENSTNTERPSQTSSSGVQSSIDVRAESRVSINGEEQVIVKEGSTSSTDSNLKIRIRSDNDTKSSVDVPGNNDSEFRLEITESTSAD